MIRKALRLKGLSLSDEEFKILMEKVTLSIKSSNSNFNFDEIIGYSIRLNKINRTHADGS